MLSPSSRQSIVSAQPSSFASNEKRRNQLIQATAAFLRDDLRTATSEATRATFQLQAPKAVEGDIASGDKFFADRADLSALLLHLPTIAAVDMESAAVAQVCYEYSVPFSVVRTISDDANPPSTIFRASSRK